MSREPFRFGRNLFPASGVSNVGNLYTQQRNRRNMRTRLRILTAISLLAASAGDAYARSAGASAPPAAATPAPEISSEQKTKIVEDVKGANVDHAAKIDIPMRVGAEVPRNLHFYPFPKEAAEIAPEYGNHSYVVVSRKIVVIDPLSYRIVAILPA